MARRKKKDFGTVAIGIRGMFRVNIVDEKAGVIGDSGWRKNVVTSDGIDQIMRLMTNPAAVMTIDVIELGTGGAVSYSNASLPGTIDTDYTKITLTRSITTAAASTSWSTLQFRATFASGWNTSAGAGGSNINNVGLYDSDGGPGGTFFAGNSYPLSNCATNQAVNVTYNLLMGSQ